MRKTTVGVPDQGQHNLAYTENGSNLNDFGFDNKERDCSIYVGRKQRC